MKKISTLFIALVVLVTACEKDVSLDQQLKTLAPVDIDADAGTWKPVFLTANNQVALAGPAALAGSVAFQAELDAIKTLQANLTDNQKKAIEYWSAGGVLRWNEILRGLVAQFNLPPAPTNLGTYPAPDAENPFGDPNFPFANPPYASRAYSYVAAAQYDALKAAWYYKYQYNRPSPYNADSGIQALMTKTTLPGYPSEDAVLSGVSAEVLKLLFPAAVEQITLKAAEQRNAALWAGKATTSDLSAGLALGKSIATVFTDRAKADGMGTAGGNPTLWAALKTNAESRGETAWASLETPARPPMLPFFGLRTFNGAPFGAKAWMMTNTDIVNERPLAPPPTASEEMAKEVQEVYYYTTHVTRERLAIVHKWADGAGTYTPAGHWDEIASHYIEEANMSEVKAARVYAYLNIALHDAAVGCWETKFFYFNPRPSQMDPAIKTATGVPNFPAYTSGHSTYSGAAGSVLSYFFPSGANFFNEQAQEASLSRLYGGIHYRKDCEAGLDHGKRIANYTLTFAKTDGAD
ncbi:MAG TPA: phosphatase PAP2 family protein [Cyclobacteriaceae bacterium]|nr:phosphatase PAP2 family protein [Cyclobacteriaceae bacterium]